MMTKLMKATQRLNDLGFTYLGTNNHNTEKFAIDEKIVTSHFNGYVRQYIPGSCYQMNLTKKVMNDNGYTSTERILLKTRVERYNRLADWCIESRRRMKVQNDAQVAKFISDNQALIDDIIAGKIK